ncbi:hypothetical protein MLD38_017564 [Melastoma candidum]|uniref:Uncharacterized protein n=1 Tax=Melastoma candidum TaxID=119954 RepID=A0ACB9QR11_9MYRT|nr:hypothetical protein MLD38_017564 [Melastoma candidum]
MSDRSASGGSINQPAGSGHVSAIGRGRAGLSSNAMSGMILVNGWDATTLFDTGATHSLISQSFVDRYGFVMDLGGSPLRALRSLDVVPNHAIRKMIQEWCVENRDHGVERIPTPRIPVSRLR